MVAVCSKYMEYSDRLLAMNQLQEPTLWSEQRELASDWSLLIFIYFFYGRGADTQIAPTSTRLTLQQWPENMKTNATKSRTRKENTMKEEVEVNNEVGTVLLKLYEIPVKMKVRDLWGKLASDFNIGPQIWLS